MGGIMYNTTRIFWLCLSLFVFFHLDISSAAEKDTLPGVDFSAIQFKDGYLRVSVKNQAFRKVMEEVAQKAGIKIVINDNTDRDLTIDFDYTHLDNGLKRLLNESNHVFFYRSEEGPDFRQSTRLTKVLILPKSGGWAMAGLGEPTEDRSTYPGNQTLAMEEMFNSNQKVRDKIFKHFFDKGVDVEAQLSNALEKLKKLNGLDLAEGEGDIKDQINKALEGLQNGTTGTMPVEGGAQENPGVEGITNALKGKIKVNNHP